MSFRCSKSAWGVLWGALVAFLVCPGPARSAFSGIPLSSRATAVAVTLIGVAIAMSVIRPLRTPRMRWVLLIALAVPLKLALSTLLITPGWQGQYFTGQRLNGGTIEPLQRVRMNRIESTLNFDRNTFGLDFLNDLQRQPDFKPFVRSNEQPIRALWRGFVELDAPAPLTVKANGLVLVRIDGQELWRGSAGPLTIAAGAHRIDVLYDKPPRVIPSLRIDGLPAATITPATRAQLRISGIASFAITLLGCVVLLGLALVLWNAYRGVTFDAAQAAILAFAAVFLLLGLTRSIPLRHATVEQKIGDDFLMYEGMSRGLLDGDILLLRGGAPGTGEPYYHYPFYAFALAGAHLVFGDDFANVILFNYICLAFVGLLVAAFLRRHLRAGIVAAVVASWLIFSVIHLPRYLSTAYCDNLYLVTMLVALLASVSALEQRRASRFLAAGVLIAIAAATRPSGFIFLPLFALVIAFDKEGGTLATRIKSIASLLGGFALAVSPFTIRNRIVSGRWVMLVGGYMSITAFLYPPEETRHIPLLVDGRMPTMSQTLQQVVTVFRAHPGDVLWVEVRKVLFTLGWPWFGPQNEILVPFLGFLPLLFVLALLMKRIPRPLAFVLSAFLLSHLASMVLAAPWTYGFKSIIPFHLACSIGAAFLLKRRPAETA
ncbi:MAG TPA: glycosyltransferase family 39 protein [Thermoanaerobaculia bacterium]|nr:glycosyltransferase family 39 protein [Thermoanaerobaculia bacterium]